MSACFQKQVGKRKKKEDDENDSDITAPTTSNSDELVIIEDSNGNGRSERLNKRRKRERDEELERAIQILNDLKIPVDEGMSRKEVIELATVLLQSKEDHPSSSAIPGGKDKGTVGSYQAAKPKSSPQERSSEDSSDGSFEPITNSKRYGQNRSRYGQSKNQEEELFDLVAASAKSGLHASSVEGGKTQRKQRKQQSPDSKDVVYESEEPVLKNARRIVDRKRQLDENPREDSQSSQENGGVATRPKKSRNLQLNRKQLETMQAKTSSLLKKTAAKVKLSQETTVSSDSQSTDQHKMADDEEETQAPGSQELFAGATLIQDDAVPGTPTSDVSDTENKPRPLRNAHKEKVTPEKAVDSLCQPYIPMKRTHYTKAAWQRKTKENDSANPPFFAPSAEDPVSYSKVILQLFNIYFRKLSQEQMKTGPCLDWGESVKPGRHMSRTVDAKGRGQDSYPWSSDSNDDIAIHSDKSSDGENKTDRRSTLKSKERGHPPRVTRSKKILRSNSNDSLKGSESDFVSEPQRIQPRRKLSTSREAIHVPPVKDEDEDSLPDYGIGSSDKPPEAGQSYYNEETQSLSPVFPSVVAQTLPMEDDLYMADTETVEPDLSEAQSDETENPSEIQPRKTIQRRQSPSEMSDYSDLPMEVGQPETGQPCPEIVSSSHGRRGVWKGKENLDLPPSEGSTGSQGSGSILNSQGEIKSFQKKHGTFNLDIEDEDSKNLDIESLVKKRESHASETRDADMDLTNFEFETEVLKTSKQMGKREDDVSSDSDKDKLDLVHDSQIVVSAKKRKNKLLKRSPGEKTDVKRLEAMSRDDFFSQEKTDFEKSKRGFKVYTLSSDSADDQKPSTSGKDRIIPIVCTDKYEKRTTAPRFSVKAVTSTRNRATVDGSDDSTEVRELHQTEAKTGKKISCPMCSKMFDYDLIERHASDCLGQEEVTSTTGDDDATAVARGSHVQGPSGDDPVGRHRVDNPVTTRAHDVDQLKEAVLEKLKPFQRPTEQCCVCYKLVPADQIEEHTDQCIAAKVQEAQRAEMDMKEQRSTRSRAREKQTSPAAQPSGFIELEDIESVSSEASDNQDPDWIEPQTVSAPSASEHESPMKFKKISELYGPVMDFKNQFNKSKAGPKRGGKRGGGSRGRGKK